MSREETTQIRLPSRAPSEVDPLLGLETARLLFAHLESSADPARHADRARDIYDRIRRLASQREASAAVDRARADTMAAPFSAGESGVTPKAR